MTFLPPRDKIVSACLAVATALALSGCGDSDTKLIASAKELLAKKDARGAVIQLKNAIQKNPNSADARFLLGKTLLDGGDPVGALVELRKAQELQAPDEQVIPEIARGMLMVGEETKLIVQYGDLVLRKEEPAADLKTTLAAAYAMQRDLDHARKAVMDALQLKPGYAPAVIVQARLTAADGDIDGALRLLDQVLAGDAANERAGMLKGELLLQAKRDPAGAMDAYRKVLAANPGSIPARAAVAGLLFQQKKLAEARTEVEALRKTAPRYPETLFLQAELAFSDHNYKAARDFCDQILKSMPNSLRVLELAGAAEYQQKNYVQAESLLARALKASPGLVLSRQLLAQTYLRTGQPSKVIDVLQPLSEGKDADGVSLALTGEAYLQLGDSKRSDEAFQRALKIAPRDPRVRTSAAVAQMAHGNSSGAIAELEAVARGDTGTRADLALISARLRQDDVAGALAAVDALQKKVPDQALPLHLRGRLLLLKHDVPGATKSFEAALAKEPNYFPSVASLAAIDLAAGRSQDARRRFDEVLMAQPKNYQAKLALAELDARTGAAATTVTASLRDATKVDPSAVQPRLVLVNRLLSSGDGQEALEAAQDAAAALPNDLQIMDALGRAQIAAGDGQRALSTFKKLSSLQPRNPMNLVRLADAYLINKDTASAAQELNHALQIQPDMMLARRGLALLALMDKRPQDAIGIAREIEQRNPKDPAAYALEGDIEASRKSWDAAAAGYRAALQRGKSAEAAAKLHGVLMAGGKRAEADRMMADWLKDNPKDATFRYYLGDLALAQADYPRAEAEYRAVLEIQPENALALNNIAWLMVKQGKPGAVAVAEKAAALAPNRAALADTLATALEAENQLPQAIEAQKHAIALEPKNASLTLRLAKLYVKQGDKSRARAELEALAKLGDRFRGQSEVTAMLKSL